MKEITLAEQYAVVALDGLESLHASMAKDAVLKGIAAARVIESFLQEESSDYSEKIQEAVNCAKALNKKEAKELEEKMVACLQEKGLLELVPDLLGCDINYYTAGIELKAYRSDDSMYLRIREGLRAEILEDGDITTETLFLLWLFRESGCIHDLFTSEEQKVVQTRMLDLASKDEVCCFLWNQEFYSTVEKLVEKFLRAKRNLFKNPYLEGINLIFPFIERRSAIFIDFVVLGTTVQSRRIAVLEHLSSFGHYVEEVKVGSETLLKIDNAYYRIVPGTYRAYKFPIQGANLVPVYW